MLRSNLIFVDLAGSERTSHIQDDLERCRMKESQMINKSLFYLTQVISLLVKKESMHIPYRNSLLTKLLKLTFIEYNCQRITEWEF